MKTKNNPFSFGKIVTGKNFFNRKTERKEIESIISNNQNLILYSPRRFGKTSLILTVLNTLKRRDKNFAFFYIDFFSINSLQDFINKMANEYMSNLSFSFEKILLTIRDAIRGITPTLTADEEGKVKIELSIASKNIDYTLEDIFNLPQKLSEKHRKKVAVFFDEFQEAVHLQDAQFLSKLRAQIQHHSKVSYIFCGSKQHLFKDIFENPNNPLFKIGETKSLQPIRRNEYARYLFVNFKKIKSDFENVHAEFIFDNYGPIPYNIQLFAHHLYNLALINPTSNIDKLLKITLEEILSNKNGEFLFIYDNLTTTMRKVLKAVIKNNGRNLFSSQNLSEYGLPSATLNKALNRLIEKGILLFDNNEYYFYDKFFKIWFEKEIL